MEVVVGVCYRIQSADKEEVDSLFRYIRHYSKGRLIIMGDFNYGDIDWSLMDCGVGGREFFDLIGDCFLTQHVKLPTRGENILDLILSSEPCMVDEVLVSNPVSTSDHNLISWKLILCTKIEENRNKVFNYDRGDYCQIINTLSEINWDSEFGCLNVTQMWDLFLDKITQCRDRFIPLKQVGKRNFPKWMNKGIKKGIKKRNKAWNKFNKAPDFQAEDKYKTLRNKINKDIKAAKKKYEEDLANRIQKDPKAFYSYIRSKHHTKERIGPLSNSNGEVIETTSESCKVLNEYFASVFTEESLDNIPEIEFRKNYCEPDKEIDFLSDVVISEEVVLKYINSLKENKTGGIDEMNSSYVLRISTAIAKPLALIFQKSFCCNEIPMHWKNANVSAIFKKGARNNPCNYRLVSLTSHFCKIFEKILKTEIVKHLEDNNLINDSQHGFRNKRSCLTNLLEFSEKVASLLDEGNPVDLIYLDFQKAFDKVPHERLLVKLQAHKIGGKVSDWIRG